MTTIDAVAGKTLPAPAMDERDIYAEQVRQLYRLSRVGYGGTLVNAVIITIALWDQIPLSGSLSTTSQLSFRGSSRTS